jgi:hypothetical protein
MPPITDLERRILSGQWNNADAEWVRYLDETLEDVSLTGFSEVGVSVENTRRLVSLLSMARRMQSAMQAELDEAV